MSRISSMTVGLVLIFIGAQLTLIKSVVLTPTATQFLQEDFQTDSQPMFSDGTNQSQFLGGVFSGSYQSGNSGSDSNSVAGQSWPYYQTGSSGASGGNNAPSTQNSSYSSSMPSVPNIGPGRRLAPPRWTKWPPLFIGVVFFLHGVALRP